MSGRGRLVRAHRPVFGYRDGSTRTTSTVEITLPAFSRHQRSRRPRRGPRSAASDAASVRGIARIEGSHGSGTRGPPFAADWYRTWRGCCVSIGSSPRRVSRKSASQIHSRTLPFFGRLNYSAVVVVERSEYLFFRRRGASVRKFDRVSIS